eukprot:CAMPEP_0113244206 /NCGR_PEP_ID=MMETSP0008_2-20120614/8273_1 /TAXON_ID=97485 /ORGANISM="Prymnesium parvum" /LENGTH=70 /DNA_ID=CAMNT_0000091799 /DNA_START=923 /DNA_END=1135 /DNA_ORIENTATION=+ /assembly_acc=CAM_ASM_000153
MIFDADSCMIFRAVSPWLSTKEGTAGAGMRILMVTVGDRKASGCGSEASSRLRMARMEGGISFDFPSAST